VVEAWRLQPTSCSYLSLDSVPLDSIDIPPEDGESRNLVGDLIYLNFQPSVSVYSQQFLATQECPLERGPPSHCYNLNDEFTPISFVTR
jgi:hypothetical protein